MVGVVGVPVGGLGIYKERMIKPYIIYDVYNILTHRTYGLWSKRIGWRWFAWLWSIGMANNGDSDGSLLGAGSLCALAA